MSQADPADTGIVVGIDLGTSNSLVARLVNGEPTEMDAIADAILRASISEVLPRLVAAQD